MPKNLEIISTTSNQLLELAKTMRSLGGNMALAGEAIERLTAESELHLQELRSYRITVENREARIAHLEAQLIAEAARTAEQKLRADQLEKQHAMQAKMHAEAARKVAELEKDAANARKAAIEECADLLSRQHSWLTNVAAATLVLNIDNNCK